MGTLVKITIACLIGGLLSAPSTARPLESPVSPVAVPRVVVRPALDARPRSTLMPGYLYFKR